jgi:predicted ATPase
VTNRNAPAVAQICWRLDGIPLAIELAASRVRSLNVEQIAARLDDRFKLLTGGSRTALPRQQTLRALIDWSYDLLSDTERIVFRRLALFSGGFTLDAAETVCCDEPIDDYDVLDYLTLLVEKSLVLASDTGADTRYGMPETVRQYALERLIASGEHEPVQKRYALYFVELAERAADVLLTRERQVWMSRIEGDYDNFRAVMVLCRDAQSRGAGLDASLILRLAGAMTWFWVPRGTPVEGQAWVEDALSRADQAPTWELANTQLGAGVFAAFLGQLERAGERMAASAATWREVGDPARLGGSLIMLSAITGAQGETVAAKELCDEGVAQLERSGDHFRLALSYRISGVLAFHLGDLANGRLLTEAATAGFKRIDAFWNVAECLNSLGDLARSSGEDSQATGYYQESLAIVRSQSLPGTIPSILQNLGGLALRRGDTGEASKLYTEAITIFQNRGDQRGVAECLGGLAGVCAVAGRYPSGARLFGATESALAAAGAVMWPSNRSDYERYKALTRPAIGDAAFEAGFAAGQAMLTEQAVALAIAEATQGPPGDVSAEPPVSGVA